MGAREIVENLVLNWIGLKRPVSIQLDITNACNLSCNHCYHSNHSNSGALPLVRWLSLLDEYAILIAKLRAKPKVIFCGGEPTASVNLLPLLKHCSKIWGTDYSAVILTNATLLSHKHDILALDPKNVRFQVSLDGPNAKLHDQHRGDGNFTRTVAGIEALVNCGFPVTLLAVLSRANASQISDFFDLAVELKADAMNFTRLIAIGAGKDFAKSTNQAELRPLELKSAFLRIMQESARAGVRSNVHSPLAALIDPDLGRSGRYWESLVVDYKGKYLASSRSRISIGHVDCIRMEEILTGNPYFKALQDRKVTKCGKCELYDVCGGDRNAAYAATGDFLGHDPGCWKEIE